MDEAKTRKKARQTETDRKKERVKERRNVDDDGDDYD